MKKVRNILAGVLLLAAFAGLFFLVSKSPILAVGSGSMEPILPTGSRIVIQEQDRYSPGDIITFRADEGEVVTHRIVSFSKKDGSLITKGDANPSNDVWEDPIVESDIRGKVVYMTPITTGAFWSTTRGIGIILCLIVMAAFLLWRVDDDDTSSADTVS